MTPRTRERSVPSGTIPTIEQAHVGAEYAWSSAGPWYRLYGPFNTTTTVSTQPELTCKMWTHSKITDIAGGRNRLTFFKEVTHDSVKHSSVMFSGLKPKSVTTQTQISPWRRYTARLDMCPIECYARIYAQDEQDAESTIPRTFDVDAALKTAFNVMYPRSGDISGDMGLLVFIAELRDFKTLVSSIRQPVLALKRLQHEYAHAPKNIGQLIGMLTKAGAEGRLLLKFAVEPFIADVKRLRSIIKDVDALMRRWNRDAAANVTYVRHHDLTQYMNYSKHWKDSYASESPIVDYYTSKVMMHKYILNEYKVKALAHLWYTPAPLAMDKITKARLLYDALGLGNAGSNIWNVIPFTFLVDYFVTTDEYFAQIQKDCIDMPVVIRGMGYSLKEQFITSATATSSGASATAVRIKQRYIRRQVPVPSLTPLGLLDSNLLHIDLPSLGQWTNVVALIRLMLGRRG